MHCFMYSKLIKIRRKISCKIGPKIDVKLAQQFMQNDPKIWCKISPKFDI